MKKVKEEVRDIKPEQARQRPAHKTHLIFNVEDLNVELDIRYEKMTAKEIKEQNKVVRKDSTGKEVSLKSFFKDQLIQQGDYRKVYVNEKGQPVPKEEQRFYQLIDGKETEVRPFERTTTFEILKVISRDVKNEFLPEDVYEVWSDNQAGLLKIADYLDKNNEVAIGRIVLTSGNFTEYLAILEPVFVEGNKFELNMTLCLKKKDFKHLLEIADAKKEAKVRPQINTRAKSLEILNAI